MNKKISVIVPCYNADKWLQQCYLSLVNQTIGIDQIEIIFVDDASTDDGRTWKTLLSFEQEYPDSVIVIQSEENKRQGGARNMALPYATGEYIAFCDADDWLDKTALEKAYACVKEKDADIVQFEQYYYINDKDIRLYAENDKEAFLEIRTVQERRHFLNSQVMTTGFSNKIYRREMLVKSGVRFAEHVIYEEPLFTYPLLFIVQRFAMIKGGLYYYRYNTNGTMLSDMNHMRTLTDHISVQIQVYECMHKTPYYADFKDEIELYFLHTCLYETISFAKKRKFPDTYTIFRHLSSIIRKYYSDMTANRYLQSGACKKQNQILLLAMKEAGPEEFYMFYDKLPEI